VAVIPVLVTPSPKFQVMVYGKTPPVVIAVKETGELTSGLVGRKVKLVERAGGGVPPTGTYWRRLPHPTPPL